MSIIEEIVREVSGNSGAAILGKDNFESIELSSSPKTLNVAAPNANVRSRSPSPTKTASLESVLNMRQLENDMLKQRLEFAEKQIRERDIQIEHYKSLVQTLQTLLSNNNMLNLNMGINMTVNSVPAQSSVNASPTTTRNNAPSMDQNQNHNSKGNQRNHHVRHLQKHQGREISQSFSSLPSAPIHPQASTSTNSNETKKHPTFQRLGKERKCVSFHEDVTVHYFEGKDKKPGN